MHLARWLLALVVALLACSAARADGAPLPPLLAPWAPWVLEEGDESRCPRIADHYVCIWPSSLTLDLSGRELRFALRVSADVERLVSLPGGRGRWPVEVQVDGKRAPVLEPRGAPAVLLGAGTHTVTGLIRFAEAPTNLEVPPAVGALRVRIDGKPLDHPRREASGLLWLADRERSAAGAPRLTISVHRRIEDAVPLRITTRLEIAAAGDAQEVVFPRVLLAGSRPIALRANLPAQLAPDGSLRLQTEPGSFRVELDAIAEGDVRELRAPALPAPWPERELWLFKADDQLRHVELSGATQVDASRTDLASDWHGLPTFVVAPAEPLRFEVKRRGEPEPPSNRLTLARTLWLDLDGDGYTVRDQLRGELRRDFRIDLAAGELGRATLRDEVDELVTTRDGRNGIELRARDLDLQTEWRLEHGRSDVPAVGYTADVEQLSATLHLPPGYALLGTRGVDRAQGTWLDSWDLFDFFFVLLTALAVGKLAGRALGAVALLALILTLHAPDAPYASWAGLLAASALTRALYRGNAGRFARSLWVLALVVLLAVLLPFVADQVRDALHPQLADQRGGAFTADIGVQRAALESTAAGGAAPIAAPMELEEREERADDVAERGRSSRIDPKASGVKSYAYRELADPSAVVQTGPGVPSWSFRSYALAWTGPVAHDERVELYILPPFATRLWSLLSALLSLALLFALGRAARLRGEPPEEGGEGSVDPAPPAPAPAPVAPTALLLLVSFALPSLPAQAQSAPSPELLQQLRARLSAPPACAPRCASVAALSLALDDTRITARAEVHAGSGAVVRAPGPLATWPIDQLRIDGSDARAAVRMDDGFLHVRIPEGIHTLELSGPVPVSAAFTLALTEPAPQRVEARGPSWTVAGQHADGTAEPSLELRRELRASGTERGEQALTAWLEVRRELELGLRFRVHTTITRLGPAGEAVLVRLPLLPGESVHEAQVRVERGVATASIPSQANAISFSSSLDPRSRVELTAAQPVVDGRLEHPYSEHWVIRPSTLYAVTFEGIPPVQRLAPGGAVESSYRPFPGERLIVHADRLEPARGSAVTIDRAEVRYTPGARIEHGELALSLRTSRGATERVMLPEDATLGTLLVDQRPHPARIVKGALEVPLEPGSHAIEITFERPSRLGFHYAPAPPRLGRPAVNVLTNITLPADRWLLWTAGPSWGPALLFWGYALTVVLVALALARVPASPLRAHQWLLLGLGLTQVAAPIALLVVGWLFALAYREKEVIAGRRLFNLVQAILVLFTFVALWALAYAVHQGLLVPPDMQVQGMMSNQNFVQWYADRTHGQLPEVTVWSAPIWLYKGLMLLWALWLAASLIHWLRFGWVALRKGGGYRPNPNRRRARSRSIRGTPGPTPPPDGPSGSADTERAGIS